MENHSDIPETPPALVRQITPSLLGPELLDQLVGDTDLCHQLGAIFHERALPAHSKALSWTEVQSVANYICTRMQLPPPSEERLFLLFEKVAQGASELPLSVFQKFFAALLRQVRHARTLQSDRGYNRSETPKASHQAQDTVHPGTDDEKPTLQQQVTQLMDILLAAPPHEIGDDATYDVAGPMLVAGVDVSGADNWLSRAVASGEGFAWDAWSSWGMLISEDGMTAMKSPSINGWCGSIGPVMSGGVQHFAIRVWHPVDDAFFVGVCATDAILNVEPKRNDKAVTWAGGKATRPGTVRLFGEKLSNQPTYVHGDIVSVVIDFNSGGVTFFKNGVMQFRFGSACRGPLSPFFSVAHSGPAASLLSWCGEEAIADAEGVSATLDEELSCARCIEVDGSMLEGGGQVLRVSLGCAALLRVPLHIHSIRAGRSKPGLGSQHTAGAKLVADCCNGLLSPDSLNGGTHCTGVTSLKLWPAIRGVRAGSFAADTRSAGATTLLLQAVLPCCLLGAPGAESRLCLKGGTNVGWSPPVDHTRLALLPLLVRMGVPKDAVNVDLRRRGFYPQGGGEVHISVQAVQNLTPLRIVSRGEAVCVRGIIFARGLARSSVKEVVERTIGLLKRSPCFSGADVLIDMDVEDEETQDDMPDKAEEQSFELECAPLTRKQRRALHMERQAASFGACGIVLVADGGLGGMISADCLSFDDFTSAPASVVKALEEQWNAGGCVDEHLMDQLIIYMAMATGTSYVICNGRTSISSLHLETATALTTQITGVPFTLTSCEGIDGAECIRVECEGLGWRNEARWGGNVFGLNVEHGIVLQLSFDESWERACLQNLPSDGIVQDEFGVRCRHVTLISMRSLRGEARQRALDSGAQLASLQLPIVEFHSEPGTAERPHGSSVFFALRRQRRWRQLVSEIAAIVGVEVPTADRLFHMSVWNSQAGDPHRSVGDVSQNDFPYDVE